MQPPPRKACAINTSQCLLSSRQQADTLPLFAHRVHIPFASCSSVNKCTGSLSHCSQELFGPLSMRALEDDRYVRQTDGYLPKANVAFVDEIFKANSAILNTLLTVLNERLFDNGTIRETVPLLCLVRLWHIHCIGCKPFGIPSSLILCPPSAT